MTNKVFLIIRIHYKTYQYGNRSWLIRSQAIAMKILDKMQEQRWTQAKVAEMLGCSQQYVSRIVKGGENLSLEMLSRIEDTLGIEVFSAT